MNANATPAETGDGQDQDNARGLVYERVTGRLLGRDCERCGTWVEYIGTGRPPRYCGKNCRNRASELRTAEARLGRQLVNGELRTEPIREVVERVTERIVERRVPVPAKPSTAREWAGQLRDLADALAEPGPLRTRHYDHRHLYHALVDVLGALDEAHPGGLDALR